MTASEGEVVAEDGDDPRFGLACQFDFDRGAPLFALVVQGDDMTWQTGWVAKAEVNGFVMHYRDSGGPWSPVVFVHGGFPSLATVWGSPNDALEEWEQRLAGNHRLVSHSRRGYHPSSCPNDGYDIDTQASDVIALMDHLAIDSAHVIGSSAGGPISYCLAARFPTRVRSLVLVGTGLNLRRTLRDRAEVLDLLRREIETLHRLGPAGASDARPPQWAVSFDALFMADEFAERGERAEYEKRLAHEHQLLATASRSVRAQFHSAEVHAIEAYLAWDGRQAAAAVRSPTLVMHGIYDRAITVEEGAELAALIPTAHFESFPASHSLLWRHDSALVRALEFIASTDEAHLL